MRFEALINSICYRVVNILMALQSSVSQILSSLFWSGPCSRQAKGYELKMFRRKEIGLRPGGKWTALADLDGQLSVPQCATLTRQKPNLAVYS